MSDSTLHRANQAAHAANHVKTAARAIQELEPLNERKSVVLALFLGFFFGAIGVALYFKSWKDFFVCMGLFILLAILLPWGPGEMGGLIFASGYGAWRAHTSNENL